MGLPTPSDLRVGFPDLRVGLTIPTGPPGGPPDPSQTSGLVSLPLMDLRMRLPTPPMISRLDFVPLPTPLGPLGEPTDPYQTIGWASLPLPNLWLGLPTPHGPPGGLHVPFRPLLDLRVGFSTPPDPSRTSGWAFRPLPKVRLGLQTPPNHPGGTPDPGRTFG